MLALTFIILKNMILHQILKNREFIIKFFHQCVEEYFYLIDYAGLGFVGEVDVEFWEDVVSGVLDEIEGFELLG